MTLYLLCDWNSYFLGNICASCLSIKMRRVKMVTFFGNSIKINIMWPLSDRRIIVGLHFNRMHFHSSYFYMYLL